MVWPSLSIGEFKRYDFGNWIWNDDEELISEVTDVDEAADEAEIAEALVDGAETAEAGKADAAMAA